MSNKIYLKGIFAYREDTLKNWEASNPVLEKGEPSIVSDATDENWLKIGDGATPWNNLPFRKGPQGIQGEKGPQGEKGEKGDKGDDAVTDQTYSPASTNAQSGKAVAEALSTISSLQLKQIEGEYWVYEGLIEGVTQTCILESIDPNPTLVNPEEKYLYFSNGVLIGTYVDVGRFNVGSNYSIFMRDYITVSIAEIVDLSDKVSFSDIDQSYSPTSENAQSGKAVAEAIASVDGTYELIETITLTEDVTSITRNTEPNGNAYRFKDVHIYFSWPNGSTKGKSVTLEVHCGNKNFSAFRSYDYAYNGSKSFIQTVYNHGKRFFIFSDASTNTRASHAYPAAIPTVTLTSDEPIDKITLTHGEAFKAETKITIWGVRA